MFSWFRRIYSQAVAFFRDYEGVGFFRHTNPIAHERGGRVVEPQPGPVLAAPAGRRDPELAHNPVDLEREPAPAPESASPFQPKVNRAQRRRISALERARLKHDRFVSPKGERPEPIHRPHRDPTQERLEAEAAAGPVIEHSPGDPGEILMDDTVDGEHMLFLERELYGTFHFRDTVLDQLELYWTYLARMKRHDPDAYAIYRRLGATIVPPATWLLHDGVHKDDPEDIHSARKKRQLTAWWKTHRPGFGCVSYGLTQRVEAYENNPPDWRLRELDAKANGKAKLTMWVPKFFYFQKYEQPPSEIQPTTGGDVYEMTIWWDKPHDPGSKKMKHGVPQSFAIYISNDGSDVHVLKTKKTYSVAPKHIQNRSYHDGKRGRKKPNAGKSVRVHNSWHYPEVFQEWARANQTDVDVFLCNLFLDTSRAFEGTGFGMTRVEVTNGDLAAVFSVDPRRMGYFFQDRDITLTKDGHRKKVFHMVRPHTRRLRDGTIRHMPFSFRGERDFDWAGYHVKITIPGRDHFLLNEFDVGMSDEEYFVNRDEDAIGAAATAELLHGWIDDGLGGDTDKPL